MNLPVHTEIAPSGTLVERLSQEIFVVKKDLKDALLRKIIAQYAERMEKE